MSSSQVFSSKQFIYFRTVIYFQNSTNLNVKNIEVYNNNGIEMALIDPDGIINITYSEFRNNSLNFSELVVNPTDGGGLYIGFTRCIPGLSTCNPTTNLYSRHREYFITQCIFHTNDNTYINAELAASESHIAFGSGIGLYVQLYRNANNNLFFISSLIFSRIVANYCGGFSIEIRHRSVHGNITIFQSYQSDNMVINYQGGEGAVVGYAIHYFNETLQCNHIKLFCCNLTGNFLLNGDKSGLTSHILNVTNSINCIKVSQLQCDSEGSIPLTKSIFSVTCNLIITSGKQPHNSSQVLSFYQYTNGDVKIAVMATQTCNLQLKSGNNHQLSSTITANFSKCTPGYIFDDQRQQCDCIHAKLSGNPVILKCDTSHLQAYVNPAFWVGFKTSNTTVLTASPCPFGYCYGSGLFRNGIPLTQEANKTILDQQACGAVYRTGRLCGKCIENYSVAMNSPEFLCKNCKHHPFGVLFFILSYIIPVTVLFYLIMTYNIRVTSGLFGAFMFIAQILGSEINFTFNYRINAATHGELEFSKILFSLYSIFNLELFRHDTFSYCLFENVGTVDILAFTLFASLYPLGLIMVYSLVRTYCSSHCLHQCLRHCRIANRAVTSGLSAFLVFCFAKINVLAFAILKQVNVAYIDSDDRWKNYMKVVYLQGNLEYFGSTHMMYTIGALTILIAIIAFPTVLLLFHPLILSLLGNLGLGESRLMKCIDCCLRINKLRPLLDSFQGNYKNSMKFFAALHFFLYRTLVLCAIIATPTSSIGTVQLILIALFLIILIIHIVTSPFKNKVDNIAHSVVYILIIVKLGMLYLFITDEGFPFLTYLGTALSSLPLLILVGYILWMLLQYICIKVLMLKTRHNGYVNLDNDPED